MSPVEPGAIDALLAEVRELKAEILNERGRGEPPVPGWAWHGTMWVRERDLAFTVRCADCSYLIRHGDIRAEPIGRQFFSVRTAMREAPEGVNPGAADESRK